MGLASSTVIFSMEERGKVLIPKEKMPEKKDKRGWGDIMRAALKPFPEAHQYALVGGYFREKEESELVKEVAKIISREETFEQIREGLKKNQIAAEERAKRERQKEAEEREKARK